MQYLYFHNKHAKSGKTYEVIYFQHVMKNFKPGCCIIFLKNQKKLKKKPKIKRMTI
jgi:predicted metal-binding protein